MSALSHFSAGGQLLHPSEVKSSMSEFCVSPLSNVVAGIGDAGIPAKLIKRSATLKPNQAVFMVIDLAPAGINDPGYKRAQAVAIIFSSDRSAPIRSSKWSPTRNALAMMVSPGFTAPLEQKKLASTT